MSTANDKYFVYVGTYAEKTAPGIHIFELDSASGALQYLDSVSGIANPSFLAIDNKANYLYAVSETSDGLVHSFAIDSQSGRLTGRNSQSTFGGSPCHVSVDHDGKALLVVNYTGGNVCLYPVNNDGTIRASSHQIQHVGSSIRLDRQKAPHPHSAVFDPTNQYAFVPDLGLDQIVVYKVNYMNYTLELHKRVLITPGSGPRHFVFHSNGRYAYGINELNATITAFGYNADEGTLQEIQTVSTLPTDTDLFNLCADIHISPAGDYLYGSNRGHDSIVIYAISNENGSLTYVGHAHIQGKTPRNFAITPDNNYLLSANQDSDTIVTFLIDHEKGILRPTGIETKVPKPVCLKIV